MIESNSPVFETHVKAPAAPRQHSPEELEILCAPPAEGQGADPMRQQVDQLLSGPQGGFHFHKQESIGPKTEFELQNGLTINGDVGFVENSIDRSWKIQAKFETGKSGSSRGYETQKQLLLDNISKIGDESLRVHAALSMRNSQARVGNESLSRQELTGVFSEVNKLMMTDSPYMSAKERTSVAVGILHHTGEGRIDQGVHSTCNVTVLQNIAFDQRPSLAAEMITTAALNGEWKAGDGKVIKIPKDSMKPGWEEEIFPPKDGLRSHASQIFQVVALNDVGQREKEPLEYVQKPQPVTSLFYALGQQFLPASEYWMPNGYEVWRDGKGQETQFAGLTGRQIQEESKRLFGDKFETISYKSPYEWLSHPWSGSEDDYKHNKMVESEEGLRQTLAQLDSEKKMPVVVAVNGEMVMKGYDTSEYIAYGVRALIRPIKTLHEYIDSKLGVANHVVTVTKFDKANDRVYVKNSWGSTQDGWVSVKELWKAV
jgi:hypothetical protein